MNKVQIIILCVLGMSCQTSTEVSQKLHYSKDYRTGLCFASYGVNANNAMMTNVPCSPEVERLITSEVKALN